MSRIPDEVIDQVRDAADIVELIGAHVTLKRTGTDYRGPCPFHGGTHRNFAVIPKKQLYYCFVCHAGGDIFRFYMQHLGFDYPSAVREVAAHVGVTIPERGATGPDPHEPFYEAGAVAQEWYARQLQEEPEGARAREYLERRGFRLQDIAPFAVGFASQSRRFLEAMERLHVSEERLEGAGLLMRREDGSPFARFRGRLLFGIHDNRGRIVGFGGRVLDRGEPKYLNSPDTRIFHKGRLLYHLHAAKHAMRKTERAVLVEGYFDVLRLALAGIEEVVAPLGTSLTEVQAQLLARYAKRVYVVYDSDKAGLRATFRAGDVLVAQGLQVSVVTLPEGEDPDSLVRQGGAEAFERHAAEAVDLVDRKLQLIERRGMLESLPGRRGALDRLLPTLRATSDNIMQELYVDRVAKALGVRSQAILSELEQRPTVRPFRRTTAPSDLETPPAANPECVLVGLWLRGTPWAERVEEAMRPEDMEDRSFRELYEQLRGGVELEMLPAHLVHPYEQAAHVVESEQEQDAWFDHAVRRMQARPLDRRLEAIDRELPLSAPERKDALVAEKTRLTARRNAIVPRFKMATRAPSGKTT